MVNEDIKKLKEKIIEIENKNIKLMWKYAPWFFKLIFAVGVLTLMYWSYRFGQYLVN